jgi:hypothetical protein
MKVAKGKDLLRKLAESEEIEIETRRDERSAVHRTTIWIVPTASGVYIRSGSRRWRWYQEALANRNVTIRVGRRKVAARVQPTTGSSVVRDVNAAYRAKYAQSWPDSAKAVVRVATQDHAARYRALGASSAGTGSGSLQATTADGRVLARSENPARSTTCSICDEGSQAWSKIVLANMR